MKTLLSILALALLNTTCAMADTTNATVRNTYPTLTSGALASARLVDLPAGMVLRSEQIKITKKDLDAEIGKAPEAIRPQLKQNMFFMLENKATQMHLQYEADNWAKQNKTAETKDNIVKAYLASLTSSLSVTDEELQSFFDKNKDMFAGATFEQVKSQLKDYLLNQKQQDAINAHIASIGDRFQMDIDKSWAEKQYSAAMNNSIDKARKSGRPTMVDLGADGCQPCEMMTPILESLKKEYAGKTNILFVHVRKEQVLAARYGIQSIPVQIFFDKDGKEVFRHVGFFPKDQITTKLVEMGVK